MQISKRKMEQMLHILKQRKLVKNLKVTQDHYSKKVVKRMDRKRLSQVE